MKEHIKILDFLRGFAALGVVFFHYNIPELKLNPISEIVYYGQYGVQIFFVISGFIIPYSMYWNKYSISDYFKNLLRRFIRIDPPSYVAILLIIVLYYMAILIVHRPIREMYWPGINFTSIIGNLTYSAMYFDIFWFNQVFWTLAIEFQFYILIGLVLPLIMKKNNLLSFVTILSMMILGYIDFKWFFKYASFFSMGLMIFMMREKLMDRRLIYTLMLLSICICYSQNNIAEFCFGLSSFIIIFSGIDFHFKFTTLLGKISYSLYITHLFVLYVLEIVVKRIIVFNQFEKSKLIILLIYVGIAITFAYFFYILIEKPFINFSKRIRMGQSKNLPEPLVINVNNQEPV